jgi:hypothetical protein
LSQFGLRQLLDCHHRIFSASHSRQELAQLDVEGQCVLVLSALNQDTMTKVATFVTVLMTSCQVSEYQNSGPAAAQARTTIKEIMKALVLPVHRLISVEKRSIASAHLCL